MVKMTKKQRKERHTAIHEAGHVVAAFLVHRQFEYVTIIPAGKENTLGHVKATRYSKETEGALDGGLGGRRVRALVEKEIIVNFGGSIAAWITGFDKKKEISQGDSQRALEWAMTVNGSPESTQAYMAWLLFRTEDMLRFPGRKELIEAVADALQEHKTLSYRRTRHIIRDKISEIIRNRRSKPSQKV